MVGQRSILILTVLNIPFGNQFHQHFIHFCQFSFAIKIQTQREKQRITLLYKTAVEMAPFLGYVEHFFGTTSFNLLLNRRQIQKLVAPLEICEGILVENHCSTYTLCAKWNNHQRVCSTSIQFLVFVFSKVIVGLGGSLLLKGFLSGRLVVGSNRKCLLNSH